MARCPSCDYPLPDNRERLGARCPSCKGPLYDPPSRLARPVRHGEAACACHPGNESVGACGRCGECYCETCRSRFADQILCVACVEKALASGAGSPREVRTHHRQALLSMLLGLGAWLLALAGFVVVQVALNSKKESFSLTFLCVALLLAAGVAALFGLGQGAAAIRVRGRHLLLASSGLVLSGLYVGALIGILTHSFW